MEPAPNAAIAALRAYLRHGETPVQSAATHVQRMQKALVQMNQRAAHLGFSLLNRDTDELLDHAVS